LGYIGSGEEIRNFDDDRLRRDFSERVLKVGAQRSGDHWSAFDVPLEELRRDVGRRFDLKYWRPDIRERIEELRSTGAQSLGGLNILETRRGRSPASEQYVDATDGYALVVKAGTGITRFGLISDVNADYIEKDVYDAMPDEVKLAKGDILISSTGDGTLGKVGVFRGSTMAIADGHVTIVRLKKRSKIHPEYLADYLRCGFGAEQIARLYTGSTGLIELAPSDVDAILVEMPGPVRMQRTLSDRLRREEAKYVAAVEAAESALFAARHSFSG
jgi:type I restriction enzyme M protein